PSPAKPAEDNPWTRQLLEAIEIVSALDEQDSAPPGSDHSRPGSGSPAHGSGADPHATAAWTPPFKPYLPPGPLESLFNSEPRDPGAGLAPAENDPDSDGPVRKQLGEHPAIDDDGTRPGSTGHSTP
ncbi:hypothetical protein, partial [Nonomuraea sp. MG754425]|uniref:hypothetical protein n=1 Tax=Nonomuraea sp. MG754425 TaxID=2570319 RepID=UPI001F3E680C